MSPYNQALKITHDPLFYHCVRKCPSVDITALFTAAYSSCNTLNSSTQRGKIKVMHLTLHCILEYIPGSIQIIP